ncbi:C-mannosyltransferase dpy-19 isoform X2 [Pseudomyrmex gracilis]|nr:C-mannosyltransferase dpy-19 isoform X2 [Pseudomyrmex gracilis]
MYYSYYKTIVESKDVLEGMMKLKHDNLSEYGNIVNAVEKYTILPEIIAGFLYHTAVNLGVIPSVHCWQVVRGEGPPVTSCEGLGVPVYFYLEIVWVSAFCTAAILFYYATNLSDSIYGGLIAILAFFFNHNDCTRVQWTPPLRETFAYPMLLYQMHRVSQSIREYTKPSKVNESTVQHRTKTAMDICFAVCFCLCAWQFSHFVFVTQIIAILILKWLRIIPYEFYRDFSVTHFLAIFVVAVTKCYIIRSYYVWLLIGSMVASCITHNLRSRHIRQEVLLEIIVTIVLTKWLAYMFYSQDEAHIFNILMAKLTTYKDFHTMLYTCSPEFDFLQYKTYQGIIVTMLLPTSIFAGMLALYYWYRSFEKNKYPFCIEADVAYNGLQTGAFIIMAVFIMRLKLFMTPHLCIIAGTACSKRYLEKAGLKNELMRGAFVILLIGAMSYHGVDKFQAERSFIGEYSNIEQEQLFEWIKSNTSEQAVFAGKMSLMANLMLSTRRAIVNNPYYESKEMRDRTMKVYEIFSRKDAISVYHSLRNMKVNFVVLDIALCSGYANLPRGCQMIDLWDVVDGGAAKTANKPPLCPILLRENAYPFRRVFANNNYVVLQLDYTHHVELKPQIIPKALHS